MTKPAELVSLVKLSEQEFKLAILSFCRFLRSLRLLPSTKFISALLLLEVDSLNFSAVWLLFRDADPIDALTVKPPSLTDLVTS